MLGGLCTVLDRAVVGGRVRHAEDFSGARAVIGCEGARAITRDGLLDPPEDLVHRWARREACIQHARPPDPVRCKIAA